MKRIMKWLVMAMALIAVLVAQGNAYAENPQFEMPQMSDAQIKAMQDARAALTLVEDDVLPKLVEAGALTQQALDEYLARRNNTGGEMRDGALPPGGATLPDGATPPDGAFPPDGEFPPDGATPPDGNGMRGNGGIMNQIDTAKAPQNLLERLQAAQDAYQAALQSAGITFGGRQ